MSTNSERVLIGSICYKGNHIALQGESDFGCCSSHYYADIYITVDAHRPNPRGEATPTVEEVAAYIAEVVARDDNNR